MITIKVPATSANCGIGFDSLGVALDWYATFKFEESNELLIEGCPKEYQNENHLFITSFKKVADILNKPMPTLHLFMEMDLPEKRGLGSSAACVVAGVIGANEYFNKPLSLDECFKIATSIEGHPDNVAPAIFGGLILSSEDSYQKISVEGWHTLAIIPNNFVETEMARKALPSLIPFESAVKQTNNAMRFILAFQQKNEKELFLSLVDYLHEPYRKIFIEEYEEINKIAKSLEIPFWISGSGSTMMACSLDQNKLSEFQDLINLNSKLLTFTNQGVKTNE